jgi:4-amino-4-deoxy-L-arabinose transferase-like glycosyltransferase
MKKYSLILLFLIFVFSFFLRTFKLGSRPLGFTWDEAALGYNAYSLLKTGRDEFGKILPVVFQSFGDYKPGLYIYSAVPSVALLGLTEFSTRLPSAIFGSLLVIIIYLLSVRLFNSKVALLAAFLLAINPWAIHFSRGAWEANLSLLLTALGALLFVRRRYPLSFLFFGLTFLTYQGAKLFTPLLIITLILIYLRPFSPKKLLLPILIFVVVILPVLVGFTGQSGRLKVFSVFNYTRPAQVVSEIFRQDNTSFPNLTFYFFHSETLDQIRGVVQRYLNHLSPRFLFIEGDWSDLRHSTPFQGYLLIPELITLVLGLNYLIRHSGPGSKLILIWLLLAPLPSALSRDIVSGVRALPEVLPLVIISAVGLSRISRKIILAPLLAMLIFFFAYYLDLYYIHSPHYTADAWLYPYKPALLAIQPYLNQFDKVYFTDLLGQPYIFVLFYYRIDPRIYQDQVKFTANTSGDVGEIRQFNQFSFGKVYWPSFRGNRSTIFVGGQYELPEQDLNIPNLERISDIYYPNGTLALRAVGLR